MTQVGARQPKVKKFCRGRLQITQKLWIMLAEQLSLSHLPQCELKIVIARQLKSAEWLLIRATVPGIIMNPQENIMSVQKVCRL